MASNHLFVITRLISLIMSQAIILLLVLYLNATEFGSLSLVLSFTQLLITFISAWHSGTMLNHGQKYFQRTNSLFTVLVFRGFWIIVLVLICVVIFDEKIIERINNFTGLKNGFYLILLFALAEVTFDYFQNILVVYGKLLKNAIAVLTVKSSCVLYIVLHFDSIEAYVEFYASVHIIYAVFVIVILLRMVRPNKACLDQDKFKELSLFSFWAFFTSLSVLAVNQAYNFLLRTSEVTLSEIGAHSLAFKAFMTLSVLVYFVRVFYPKALYAKSIQEKFIFLRKVFEVYLQQYLVAVSCAYFIICILVDVFTNYSQGAGYEGSTMLVILYFPAFILFQRAQFLCVLLNNSIYYNKENMTYIIMSIFNLAANVVLINLYGVYGVILATTIGWFCFNLILSRHINQRFFLSLRRSH